MESMFEYSFVDFDSTLYETHRLSAGMREIFLANGVAERDIDASRKEAERDVAGNYRGYTFGHQVDNLRARGYNLPSTLVSKLDDLLKENHQNESAEEFLKFLKGISGKTVLLSAGHDVFQKQKLFSTRLENFFDEIYIVRGDGGKDELVKQKIGAGRSLFVNDSIQENLAISKLFPNVLVVSRVNPRKVEQEYANSGLPYFHNLVEIQKYVAEQIQ